MGDHRAVSQDARCQGPVPIKNIIGRAFVIVWPSSRFTSLSVPDVWKTYAADHPSAMAEHALPVQKPTPASDGLLFPFLLATELRRSPGGVFGSWSQLGQLDPEIPEPDPFRPGRMARIELHIGH